MTATATATVHPLPLGHDQPWLQTASGRAWPLLSPSPTDLHWPDLAEGLGKQCRFSGATRTFYSVAQHCILVAEQLPPEWRAYGLLHDAHKALIGDMPTPVRAALRTLGGAEAWERLEAATDAAIYRAAGLPWPAPMEVRAAVKRADLRALATEVRDLMTTPERQWEPLPDPLPRVIRPLPWPAACADYLTALATHIPATADQLATHGRA